jgi:uncharacterized OB-fold protein/acyl dehydratase
MTSPDADTSDLSPFEQKLATYSEVAVGQPTPAPDEVNQAMIRHWVEAMGDELPVYTDEAAAAASVHGQIVAPPVMLQAWVMRGITGGRGSADGTPTPQDELYDLLDSNGFSSVVATNCEQTYVRYLTLGDRLSMSTVIESVSPEKQTGLGIGHFVTTRADYSDQDGNLVGSMKFRILKFKPGTGRTAKKPAAEAAPTKADDEKPRPLRPRPSLNEDNRWWFEAAKQGELRIQRCTACNELRHPPGPACPHCGSFDWDTVVASGKGTIYSFVVTHYPKVPAFDYPLPIVLVELEEGVRQVSNLLGVEPDQVQIGTPVQVEFVEFDDELTLPQFRPVAGGSD